ncbi:MAG: polysaccharide biosynthesis/export family protein [Desulfuromonadales bacterium]|nr:polysaccharide biosynthesis/export family protein [Desulfuromonadales bacterium]
MTKNLMLVLFALLLLSPLSVCAGDYVIGEGDGLDIAVWGVRDLNTSVRVRPDGKITIPGLGEVVASGLTPKALQLDLSERLKELVKNPIVTVTVRDITNSRVYMFGSGVQPGVVDLNRRTTLLQLLCTIGSTPSPQVGTGVAAGTASSSRAGGAGGGQTSASSRIPDFKKAYVLRKGKKIKEDFTRLFINGEVGEDILIESNDAVFIPQLPDSNIYVLGAVAAPRSIEFRDGMTVMEAILECGGFTRFAKQNSTVIYRKENGKDSSIEVKAKDLVNDADLSQNIKLKPGDYVIVKEGMF